MSKQDMKEPAVIVAEKREGVEGDSGRVTLSTGIEAILVPVSASLIDEVTAKVRDPEVPMWHNEDKGREEPNPGDPRYIQALSDAERERGKAAMDALVMFGVELVEDMPDDNTWLEKLQFLGVVEDREVTGMERLFFYKKFVAVSATDIGKITELSGISQEDVEEAEATFQRT